MLFGSSMLGVVGYGGGEAVAGFIFEERFSDTDFGDGDPVTWTIDRTLPGVMDASFGNLVMTADDARGATIAALGDVHEDSSVRVNVRVTGTNWSGGVIARATDRGADSGFGDGYFATVAHLPAFGGSVLAAGRLGNAVGENDLFNSTAGSPVFPLPFDVRDVETSIQMDVFGDEIKVWAWPTGERMPDSPGFDVVDDNALAPGFVALTLNSAIQGGSASGRAEFSYVGLSSQSIPEPSTAALGVIALMSLLVQRRSRF